MGEDESKNFYKQKQGINIAMASQLRIHYILDKIVELDANYPIDSPEKQKVYLSLIKQYLVSATPHLSNADGEKYRKEILSFSIKKKSNVSKGMQKFGYEFDTKLDVRLNQILMELQQRLRHLFSKVVDEDSSDPYN